LHDSSLCLFALPLKKCLWQHLRVFAAGDFSQVETKYEVRSNHQVNAYFVKISELFKSLLSCFFAA